MAVISVVALVAVLLGVVGGYALSKQAVEWCPTCGRSLAGHCPDQLLVRHQPDHAALDDRRLLHRRERVAQ
jgi:hypothetical protein